MGQTMHIEKYICELFCSLLMRVWLVVDVGWTKPNESPIAAHTRKLRKTLISTQT